MWIRDRLGTYHNIEGKKKYRFKYSNASFFRTICDRYVPATNEKTIAAPPNSRCENCVDIIKKEVNT